MHLYNCKSHSPVGPWYITKFDLDLNVLASYTVSHDECECPRGAHSTCRHRKMLRVFISGGHIDDGWFLDYETRLWTPAVDGVGAKNAREFAELQSSCAAPTQLTGADDAEERPRVAREVKSDPSRANLITRIRPLR